eukprot:jgi/Bigna1/146305/aug1.112_g21013
MSSMVEGKQEDEENLKKEVEKVVLNTVGETDYDTDKNAFILFCTQDEEGWVQKRCPCGNSPSKNGTDVVTMVETKTEKVNVMVFIAMMKYD